MSILSDTVRGVGRLLFPVRCPVCGGEMPPGSRVVCLCGDGGFGHSWAELETLRRLKLPLTVVVLNNGIEFAATYLVMIAANGAANALPLNGRG